MIDCPNCNKPTITLWQKMALGPAGRTTCKGCDAKVSVPWSAMLAAMPLAITAGLSGTVLTSLGAIGGSLLLGFGAWCWLHWKYVPLIQKSS